MQAGNVQCDRIVVSHIFLSLLRLYLFSFYLVFNCFVPRFMSCCCNRSCKEEEPVGRLRPTEVAAAVTKGLTTASWRSATVEGPLSPGALYCASQVTETTTTTKKYDRYFDILLRVAPLSLLATSLIRYLHRPKYSYSSPAVGRHITHNHTTDDHIRVLIFFFCFSLSWW